MGTSWSARIVDAPPGCLSAIEDVLARVIAQMSNWEAKSDISRFNASLIGSWTSLPSDMMAVLDAGLTMARLSNGAFDPAIGRMVERWGFGPLGIAGPEMVPTHPAPWTMIEIADRSARRLADVQLDFSGIAKGFAVDAVAEALRDLGARHFLVEIGGELRGEGVKPDHQPWWVDVETPPSIAIPTLRIALCGLSVATSGDYVRSRTEEGAHLSHSIDPSTGRPIANNVASVTVLHESAMLADAWATAITIMGHEQGMTLATGHDVAARLILRTGDGAMEYMTPALASMLD
ncbi:MAG TPA: FAD:protein FMN transferase [Sphingobium sp.]|nr:FAD:protein FMN transferase [Sphingobium sp.]